MNSELLDLKNKFTKLESDLEISRNVNNKLVDQATRLERKCWENEEGMYRSLWNPSKYRTVRFGEDIITRF